MRLNVLLLLNDLIPRWLHPASSIPTSNSSDIFFASCKLIAQHGSYIALSDVAVCAGIAISQACEGFRAELPARVVHAFKHL